MEQWRATRFCSGRNTHYPDPRAMTLLHTPTTTDVDSPSFETDSEVVYLASCIDSSHRAPSTPAVLSSPPTLHEIGAEAEAEHEHEHPDHEGYSPESSSTIIDKDGEAQEDSEVQRNDDGPPRLLRTLDRPAFAPTSGFTPTQLRSGSSPSRPPVRLPFGTLPPSGLPKGPRPHSRTSSSHEASR